MQVLHAFDDLEACRGGYLAIGNFDGVHLGHRRMLATLVARARSDQVPAVVLTFSPHPIELLAPEKAPPSLSTLERKAELIRALGVDHLIAYPTDRPLLALSAEEFFEQIVLRSLQVRGLVEGPNFFFGHNRGGDVALLRTLCDRAGLTLDIVEPVSYDGELVSSSRIRRLITYGDVAAAVRLLGHPYQVSGRVTRGDSRGQSLGYPTANVSEIETLLPSDGVYAAATMVDGIPYPVALHIGSNPTFDQDDRKVEAHLIGFSGDLYGRTLKIDLHDRLRGTTKFASSAELQAQLEKDCQAAIDRLRQTAAEGSS